MNPKIIPGLAFIFFAVGALGLFRYSQNVRTVDVIGLFASGAACGAALVGSVDPNFDLRFANVKSVRSLILRRILELPAIFGVFLTFLSLARADFKTKISRFSPNLDLLRIDFRS